MAGTIIFRVKIANLAQAAKLQDYLEAEGHAYEYSADDDGKARKGSKKHGRHYPVTNAVVEMVLNAVANNPQFKNAAIKTTTGLPHGVSTIAKIRAHNHAAVARYYKSKGQKMPSQAELKLMGGRASDK